MVKNGGVDKEEGRSRRVFARFSTLPPPTRISKMAEKLNGRNVVVGKSLVINIDLANKDELRKRFEHMYRLNLEPKRCDERQSEYRLKLLEVERRLNLRAAGEPMVAVENRVDYESFPRDFQYTRTNIPGPGVKLVIDPNYVVGCECELCTGNECSCPLDSHGEFAYDDRGRVTIDRRRPIFECNFKCRCGSNCSNRVVQLGRQAKVCIFRTKRKGWGLKTLDYIKANQFVTEYVGEVITNEEAERRGKLYDKMGRTYLFDLDYNEGDCLYTIDAYCYGNVAHFINHSCDPNLIVYGVWIDNLDPHLPHIALFAIRDIQPGEELTFDYLMADDQSQQHSKRQTKRMRCQCKAANCRKWLF